MVNHNSCNERDVSPMQLTDASPRAAVLIKDVSSPISACHTHTSVGCFARTSARKDAHRVKLMIMFMGPKWVEKSQFVFGKLATGTPYRSTATKL